jgi:hypothetical protein
MRPKKPRRVSLESWTRPLLDPKPLSELERRVIFANLQAQAKAQRRDLVWDDLLDWSRIERMHARYLFDRRCESDVLEDGQSDPVALVRGAAARLVAALDGVAPGSARPEVWSMIFGGHPDFTQERLAFLAKSMRDKLLEYDAVASPFLKIKIGEARSTLIAELAAFFQEKGLRATAGNPYQPRAGGEPGPLSPFVATIKVIMLSVPRELKEDLHSLEGFSKAVSREINP